MALRTGLATGVLLSVGNEPAGGRHRSRHSVTLALDGFPTRWNSGPPRDRATSHDGGVSVRLGNRHTGVESAMPRTQVCCAQGPAQSHHESHIGHDAAAVASTHKASWPRRDTLEPSTPRQSTVLRPGRRPDKLPELMFVRW